MRSSNFHNFAVRSAKGCLAANHVSAVAQHEYGHEWIAVCVPANDRLIIFPWATGNTLIVSKETLLLVNGSQLLLTLLIRFYGEVDMCNVVVYRGN